MALYDPAPPAQRALAAAVADPAAVAASLQLEPQQVLNLARLATFLRALPADYTGFNMRTFLTAPDPEHPSGNRLISLKRFKTADYCGSVACAVGHGPAAGVQALPGEYWTCYAERAFVGYYLDDEPYSLFRALFYDDWQACDATPRGAAARIAFVLAHPQRAAELAALCGKSAAPALYAAYLA